jgi:hypothetical protein
MSQRDHDTPPHQAGSLAPTPAPAPNPNLQDTVAQLVQLMTAQLQANIQAQAPEQAPYIPAEPWRPRIKTHNPDPYDGTDPSKLRAFLSQCRLTFRSRPNNFADDQFKITYAISWLKGTALHWYKLW